MMTFEIPVNRPLDNSCPTGAVWRNFSRALGLISVIFSLLSTANIVAAESDEIIVMQKQIAALQQQLGMLQDTDDIRNLQHAYGYYLDKCLYEEVVGLFAEDSLVKFNGGIYKGKAGVKRLYIDTFQQIFTKGFNGPITGFLLDHPQLQDVIHVSPDRKTANARFRTLMQAGVHESSRAPMAENARKEGRPLPQWWEGGIYENSYVRENGVWKIKILNYNPLWHADYATGWTNTRPEYVPPFSETYPENPTGPDELDPDYLGLWPKTEVVPFHYVHPVSGKSWKK